MRRFVAAGLVCCMWACGEVEESNEGLTNEGGYYIYWDSVPSVIPFNEPFSLSAMVHDGTDRDLMYTDRELLVDATMPAHEHGMETVPEVTASESGVYTVDGMLFHMAGEWELVFQVVYEGDTETATFTLDCCEQ